MPLTTELRWDGKYDAHGKRVPPLRVKLPFQTVESVSESTRDRQTLFRTRPDDHPWRNRLIWGDKKYVLPALLDEFAGKVNLVYIDPPFDTGADFSFTAAVPDAPDGDDADPLAFTKEPSIIEQKAYRDTWGRGLDSYLQWFYETVTVLHELLAENGSIYVHLDYHVSHYVKAVLDEVLGPERFLNEISWKRTFAHGSSDRYGPVHDLILFYAKGESPTWTDFRTPHDPEYIANHFTQADPKTGRRFQPISLTGTGIRRGDSGKPWRGVDPTKVGRHWALPGHLLAKLSITGSTVQDRLDELDKHEMIFWPQKADGTPRLKHYVDELDGVALSDFWADIPPISAQSVERVGYPTQKPEALLDRILRASSNDNDLILDCFCGSGTTAAVAEKLNRRWIACDLGRFAVHTTRKRLLNIENVRPFVVQNLGKYERQHWQTGQFAADGPETAEQVAKRQQAYIDFILRLYHATPVAGRALLHGVKNGRMVHVGGVDAPVSDGDVRQIAAEYRKAMGTGKDAPTGNGVDVLGWDFAFEVNEVSRQQAERANLNLRFLRIPRDVMDKRAVDQGDVRFFELAALDVAVKTKKLDVALSLTGFVIPPDDVPEEVRTAVTHWSQWIDYWAVDWDHGGDAFHNEWQTFRTRKQPKLAPAATHTYEKAGEYNVMVKVIDILGNDTTKTVRVVVK